MSLDISIEDRAWPAWVWSPQDRSIVAANKTARSLWKLAPATSISGFLFPARARITRRLHGAAIALLAGADQVQIDIRLPFASEETWQCRRIKSPDYPDGLLLLEAPQLGTTASSGNEALEKIDRRNRRDGLWPDDAFNALAFPVVMLAGDGVILHLNEEAQRLAPSDLMTEAVGDLWSRPDKFRDFFKLPADIDHALEAIAEAHRTGSASLIVTLKGVPGYPGGRCQVLMQRIGKNHDQAPLMVTFHKLARSESRAAEVLGDQTDKQTKSALDFSELQSELASLGVLAFGLDAENRVVFFTPAFAVWLDRPDQDIGGRRISELGLTPVHSPAIMQMPNQGLQDGRFLIRRADGTISTVHITTITVPGGTGGDSRRHEKRICIAKTLDDRPVPTTSLAPSDPLAVRPGIFSDTPFKFDLLTDDDSEIEDEDKDNLVRLDDWREGEEIVLTGGSFQALIEGLDVALVGLGKDGKINFVNDATAKLLESTGDDMKGLLFKDLFDPRGASALSSYFAAPEGENTARFAKGVIVRRRETAAKEYIHPRITLRVHALREHSPIRFCAFLKSADSASAVPATRTAPGSKPKTEDAKTSSSKKRADFVARVSHEIRTPLNAILGFSDLILSESMGPIGNEKYKEYLNDIHDSGRLILDLVNDILDLAKAEADGITVDLKGISIENTMRQAASMLSGQAEIQGVRLTMNIAHPLPIVLADERSVMQILLNLISNAIKFTRSGGEVSISAKPWGKDHVCLAVQDTGIGMSAGELERAMEPYQQVEANKLVDDSGKPVGTGLGLPISKALAEANRAEFKIESARNAGTRVEILFNRARVAAE